MKKSALYLLTALLFFTSCKKEFSLDGSSISSQDYISFTMLNQNIVYSDSLKNNPDSLIGLYYNGITDTSLSASGNIKIYALVALAVRTKDTSMVSLLVEGLSPITSAAKYNFVDSAALNDSNGLAKPKFFGLTYAIGSTTGYGFIDETQTTGYIQINSFSLTDKLVEGTFVQNNCAKYNSNNDILLQGFNMTNGAFRLKMIVVSQSDYDKYKSYLH